MNASDYSICLTILLLFISLFLINDFAIGMQPSDTWLLLKVAWILPATIFFFLFLNSNTKLIRNVTSCVTKAIESIQWVIVIGEAPVIVRHCAIVKGVPEMFSSLMSFILVSFAFNRLSVHKHVFMMFLNWQNDWHYGWYSYRETLVLHSSVIFFHLSCLFHSFSPL